MREQPFHLEFEKQVKELRQLSGELLQDLIEVLPYAKSWAGWDDAVVRNAEQTITKAKEKLKYPDEHLT